MVSRRKDLQRSSCNLGEDMEWKYKYGHQQYIGRSKNHGHRRNCLGDHQRVRVEVDSGKKEN